MLHARLLRSEEDLQKGNVLFEINTSRVLLSVTFGTLYIWRKKFWGDCEPYPVCSKPEVYHTLQATPIAEGCGLHDRSSGVPKARPRFFLGGPSSHVS